MLTTLQVRAIMLKHKSKSYSGIYTNKVKNPSHRSVKCYFNFDAYEELVAACGAENVRVTAGFFARGITVRALAV